MPKTLAEVEAETVALSGRLAKLEAGAMLRHDFKPLAEPYQKSRDDDTDEDRFITYQVLVCLSCAEPHTKEIVVSDRRPKPKKEKPDGR
jgi:hypothetical protein